MIVQRNPASVAAAAEAALAAERAAMRAYRLAFEDACAATSYGAGNLLDAIDAAKLAAGPAQARRYDNITIFERTKPEVAAFLQQPGGIELPDEAVDELFRLAMQIEAGAA